MQAWKTGRKLRIKSSGEVVEYDSPVAYCPGNIWVRIPMGYTHSYTQVKLTDIEAVDEADKAPPGQSPKCHAWNHKWKLYRGFIDSFEYCEVCDTKKGNKD